MRKAMTIVLLCATAGVASPGRPQSIDLAAAPYSIVCDGAKDVTAQVAAAIVQAQARGHGEIRFPAGVCVVSDVLASTSGTVAFQGAGRNVTIIRTTSPTADVFSFTGAAFDGTVADLSIASIAAAPVSGVGVRQADGVGHVMVRNVRMRNLHGGVAMSNQGVRGVLGLEDVDFSDIRDDTILIEGASQVFATNVTAFTSHGAGACLHIRDAGGVYVQGMTCGGTRTGLLIDPPVGSAVFDAFVSNFEADNSNGPGIVLDSSPGGLIHSIMLTNVRAGFSAGAGFVFDGVRTRNVTITNCVAARNLGEGLLVRDLRDSVITGCQVLGNSAVAPGRNGVQIDGGDGIRLADSRVGAFPDQGNLNVPYSLAIGSRFTGRLEIVGDDLRGARLGAVLNASTGRGVIIEDSAGYNPVGLSSGVVGPSPARLASGPSPTTFYITQAGAGLATVAIGGHLVGESRAGAPVTVTLGPNEACTVTWSGAAPSYVAAVH